MDYFRQPGVFDLHFEGSDGLAYTETEVWPMTGFSDIDMRYDLVTFGNTKVQIYGDASSLSLSEAVMTDPDRFSNTLSVNAHNASQSGHTQLSFQLRTADKDVGSNYEKMLDSDYNTSYASVPAEVKPGTFGYDSLFRSGNPVRNDGENPLENPLYFWPYVLPITNGLDLPQATVLFSAPEGVQLEIRDTTYYDGSGYPNVFQPLGASYQVYLDTPEETYSIRAPLLINAGSGTYYVFDHWVAMDNNSVELSATGIFEDYENTQTKVVFTDAIATIEAKYVEVELIIPETPEVSIYAQGGNVYLVGPKNWFDGSGFTKFSVAHTGDVDFYGYPGHYRIDPHTDCTITVSYTAIEPGDWVNVGSQMPAIPAGTVITMPVNSSVEIESSNPFQGEPGNPVVLCSADGLSSWQGVNAYDDISYLVIKDIENAVGLYGNNRTITSVTVKNSTGWGLSASTNYSQHSLELHDVIIEDCNIGIEVSGYDELILDNCQVNSSVEIGIKIENMGNNLSIQRCLTVQCGTGIQVNVDEDVSAANADINNVTISECSLGLSITSYRSTQNIKVWNSVIAFNDTAYSISYGGNPNHPNSMYRYYSCAYGNNMEYAYDSDEFGHEGNNITSDPLVDDDYHLQEGSPCIDEGDPNSPNDPDSTRTDMGAYYYHQYPATPQNLASAFLPADDPDFTCGDCHSNSLGGVDLAWEVVTEPDFSYYILYRSDNPGDCIRCHSSGSDPGSINDPGAASDPYLLGKDCPSLSGEQVNIQKDRIQVDTGCRSGLPETRTLTFTPLWAWGRPWWIDIEVLPDYTYIYYVTSVDELSYESDRSNFTDTYVPTEGRASRLLVGEAVPKEYALHGNYPNPFNPTTSIRYDLPEASYVSLVIFDILGREIRTLLDNREEAGFKSVVWDGKDNFGNGISTGIYIYVLKAWSLESDKTFQKTEKMVLLR